MVTILLNISLFAVWAFADEINWVDPSLEKALDKARSLSKPVMIDFYTDWCGWCKKLDETTYANSNVVELSRKFVCLKLDADGEGAEAVRRYQIRGFPTILFLNSAGEETKRVVGYMGPAEFAVVMREVLKGGRSLRELKSLLNANPNDPEANYRMGMRQLRNQNINRAIIHFGRAIKADPENSSGYLDEAEFQMLILRTEGFMSRLIPLLALIEQGEAVNLDALSAMQKSKLLLPFTDPRALELTNQAQEEFARYRKAVKEASAKRKEETTSRIKNLSREMGKYLTERFEGFLERFPEADQSEEALGFLLSAYRTAGDKDGFFGVYERVLPMKDEDAMFLNNYAWELYQEDRDLPKAKKLAEKAYSLEPESAAVIDTLACIEFKLGNRERAIELQEKAVSLEPDDEQLRKHLVDFKKAKAPSGD